MYSATHPSFLRFLIPYIFFNCLYLEFMAIYVVYVDTKEWKYGEFNH